MKGPQPRAVHGRLLCGPWRGTPHVYTAGPRSTATSMCCLLRSVPSGRVHLRAGHRVPVTRPRCWPLAAWCFPGRLGLTSARPGSQRGASTLSRVSHPRGCAHSGTMFPCFVSRRQQSPTGVGWVRVSAAPGLRVCDGLRVCCRPSGAVLQSHLVPEPHPWPHLHTAYRLGE